MQTVEYKYKGYVIVLEEIRDPKGSDRNVWSYFIKETKIDGAWAPILSDDCTLSKKAANKRARRDVKTLNRRGVL